MLELNSTGSSFHNTIERRRREGELICQPRMGFSDFAKMRRGLAAVKACEAPTVGTLTLDSYTRVNDWESARRAIEGGDELNGFPIVAYGPERTRELLHGIQDESFPVQVRHGTALPEEIFKTLISAGIDATEGGPISYCLPYSRVPLERAVEAWRRCCSLLASMSARGATPHLESFGGCMLGQLCPPSMLVAITVIEGLFFVRHGLHSISLSYAQNSNSAQDEGAILALRDLAAELLPDAAWHVVVYTFMGKFPQTELGARALIEESARLAKRSGCERLIVKTTAEAHQIATIEDNTRALEWSYRASLAAGEPEFADRVAWHREKTYQEARFLVDLVCDLRPSLSEGILQAFRLGYLDVPYCLHQDNPNRARSWVDHDGNVQWADTGKIPFPKKLAESIFKMRRPMTSSAFHAMLSFNSNKYDALGSPSQGDAR